MKPALGGDALGWSSVLPIGLALAAAAGCWQLGTAWYEGTTVAHDFIQDYSMIKGVLARENPYLPHNDVMYEIFGPPRIRPKLWPGHWPSSLPFLLPIAPGVALGSHTAAFLTWGIISLASFLALIALTLHTLGVGRPILLGVSIAMALIVLPPIRENFAEGQLNPLVALGMVLTWVFHRRGQPVWAGVSLGLAFGLKPVPGLFILYFFLRRDWILLFASLAVVVGLNLVGLALAGFEGVRHYFTINYPSHAIFWTGYPDNASLTGFFTRLFGPIPYDWPKPVYPIQGATPILTTVCGSVLAGLVWLESRGQQRRPEVTDLEFVALSILSLLVAPYIWPHYYIFLVAPCGVVAQSIWQSGGTWKPSRVFAFGLLAVALAVMANAYWSEPPRQVGGLQLSALLALFSVCLLALRFQVRRSRERRGTESLASVPEPA